VRGGDGGALEVEAADPPAPQIEDLEAGERALAQMADDPVTVAWELRDPPRLRTTRGRPPESWATGCPYGLHSALLTWAEKICGGASYIRDETV
jgi:hypothetical protein